MYIQIFNRSGSHFTKIRAVIVVGFAILLLLFFSTNDFFSKKEAELSYRNVLNMAVDGDEFWVARAREHGFQTAISANDSELIHHLQVGEKTCNNFFVIWPGDCLKSHSYLDERIRTLSSQMVVMNSSLTFFTTNLLGCTWEQYACVKVELFNATEELTTFGFSDVIPIMESWDKTRYTRLSDILRLCLAHRHRMSYLDSDVHFLQLQRGWYEVPYVGAQLWSDSKNAIEITNAAFCLPRHILEDMMAFQRSVIVRKREGKHVKYFYTELGPSMFHHVRKILQCVLFNWS